MYYLITFEINGFIKLKTGDSETKYQFEGKEGGVPTFDVSSTPIVYQTELLDDYAPEYGETLSELRGIGFKKFVVVNFGTVIIETDQKHQLSIELIKEILGNNRFCLVAIDEIAATNISSITQLKDLMN